MTARNIKTGDIYEGGKTYIASVIGVDRVTLWRWENKTDIESEVYNGFEVRFTSVIREKQKKGQNSPISNRYNL
jgi:hypothetical protein